MQTPEAEQILRLLCTCTPENILLAEQLAQSVSINIPELLDNEGFNGLGVSQVSDFKEFFLLYDAYGLVEVSDKNGLQALRFFPLTTELGIDAFDVENLSGLRFVPKLRILSLCYTAVSDLSPLSALTDLEELNLSGTQTEDLAPIANLPKLRVLDCANTYITDLTPVVSLPMLERLDISETNIGDWDLAPLLEAELPSLKQLNCENTQISAERIEAFKRKHPHTNISYWNTDTYEGEDISGY